jgi:Toprim domain
LRLQSAAPLPFSDDYFPRFSAISEWCWRAGKVCLAKLLRRLARRESARGVATVRPLSAIGKKLGTWRALGATGHAAIKLTDDPEVTHHLAIGEGVETTLSGMTLGYAPAWAIGCAGGLRAFPVLAGIESLTVLVDHDRAGQEAAAACSARWTSAGREVFRFVPRQPGADVNDLLVAILGSK